MFPGNILTLSIVLKNRGNIVYCCTLWLILQVTPSTTTLCIISHLERLGFHSGEGFSPAGNHLFKALGASGGQEKALEATFANAGYVQSPESVVPVEGISLLLCIVFNVVIVSCRTCLESGVDGRLVCVSCAIDWGLAIIL